MTDILENDIKMGYIASILSIVIAFAAMFGPFPYIVCVILVVVGLICAVLGIMKGDTGGKIIGAIGLLIGLVNIFLVLLVESF